MNIGDLLKNGALSSGIGLIELLDPKLKPEIEQIQQDIKDGKVTVENFEATLDVTITTAEGYVPEKWDPFLEKTKVCIRDLIELEQLGAAAIKA